MLKNVWNTMRQKFSEPKSETQVRPTRAESRNADEEPVETITKKQHADFL